MFPKEVGPTVSRGGGERFEWFAILYKGTFKPEKAGHYTFRLYSDDGAKLYIDDSPVVNNDGVHPAISNEGSIDLDRSEHHISVYNISRARGFM